MTEQTHTEARELATLAETIHNARWPEGCKPTPFADEDSHCREYCFRIARAVLAATRPATSEAVAWATPAAIEHLKNGRMVTVNGVAGLWMNEVPLYTAPSVSPPPVAAERAIRFAVENISDDFERFEFLQCWLLGKTDEWPELAALSRNEAAKPTSKTP